MRYRHTFMYPVRPFTPCLMCSVRPALPILHSRKNKTPGFLVPGFFELAGYILGVTCSFLEPPGPGCNTIHTAKRLRPGCALCRSMFCNQ